MSSLCDDLQANEPAQDARARLLYCPIKCNEVENHRRLEDADDHAAANTSVMSMIIQQPFGVKRDTAPGANQSNSRIDRGGTKPENR